MARVIDDGTVPFACEFREFHRSHATTRLPFGSLVATKDSDESLNFYRLGEDTSYGKVVEALWQSFSLVEVRQSAASVPSTNDFANFVKSKDSEGARAGEGGKFRSGGASEMEQSIARISRVIDLTKGGGDTSYVEIDKQFCVPDSQHTAKILKALEQSGQTAFQCRSGENRSVFYFILRCVLSSCKDMAHEDRIRFLVSSVDRARMVIPRALGYVSDDSHKFEFVLRLARLSCCYPTSGALTSKSWDFPALKDRATVKFVHDESSIMQQCVVFVYEKGSTFEGLWTELGALKVDAEAFAKSQQRWSVVVLLGLRPDNLRAVVENHKDSLLVFVTSNLGACMLHRKWHLRPLVQYLDCRTPTYHTSGVSAKSMGLEYFYHPEHMKSVKDSTGQVRYELPNHEIPLSSVFVGRNGGHVTYMLPGLIDVCFASSSLRHSCSQVPILKSEKPAELWCYRQIFGHKAGKDASDGILDLENGVFAIQSRAASLAECDRTTCSLFLTRDSYPNLQSSRRYLLSATPRSRIPLQSLLVFWMKNHDASDFYIEFANDLETHALYVALFVNIMGNHARTLHEFRTLCRRMQTSTGFFFTDSACDSYHIETLVKLVMARASDPCGSDFFGPCASSRKRKVPEGSLGSGPARSASAAQRPSADALRVLDVGCGTAQIFHQWHWQWLDEGAHVVGIDVCDSAIEGAREKGNYKETHAMPVYQYFVQEFKRHPIPIQFDVIVLSQSLHYLYTDEDAWIAMNGMLRASGTIAFIAPNGVRCASVAIRNDVWSRKHSAQLWSQTTKGFEGSRIWFPSTLASDNIRFDSLTDGIVQNEEPLLDPFKLMKIARKYGFEPSSALENHRASELRAACKMSLEWFGFCFSAGNGNLRDLSDLYFLGALTKRRDVSVPEKEPALYVHNSMTCVYCYRERRKKANISVLPVCTQRKRFQHQHKGKNRRNFNQFMRSVLGVSGVASSSEKGAMLDTLLGLIPDGFRGVTEKTKAGVLESYARALFSNAGVAWVCSLFPLSFQIPFMGMMPHTFRAGEIAHISRGLTGDISACLKLDGYRFTVVVREGRIFFIARDMSVYEKKDGSTVAMDTDSAEVAMDTDSAGVAMDTDSAEPFVCDGELVRLNRSLQDVHFVFHDAYGDASPHAALLEHHCIFKKASVPLRIHYDLQQTAQALRELQGTDYKQDGFILRMTNGGMEYKLKFHNSIDALCEVVKGTQGEFVFLYARTGNANEKLLIGILDRKTVPAGEQASLYGGVVEAVLKHPRVSMFPLVWDFVGTRVDKSGLDSTNSKRTIEDTIRLVSDQVPVQEMFASLSMPHRDGKAAAVGGGDIAPTILNNPTFGETCRAKLQESMPSDTSVIPCVVRSFEVFAVEKGMSLRNHPCEAIDFTTKLTKSFFLKDRRRDAIWCRSLVSAILAAKTSGNSVEQAFTRAFEEVLDGKIKL